MKLLHLYANCKIQFLKGVYNLKPSKPRYTHTWDVFIVLQNLKTLSPFNALSLKHLTQISYADFCNMCYKIQSIRCLKLHNMTKKKYSLEVCYDEPLKTSRPNFVVPKTILKAYVLLRVNIRQEQ